MFHLSRQERLVLIYLGLVIFVGSSLKYVFKKSPRFHNFVNVIEGERVFPKVNLNRASYDQLLQIPYIGPRTAERIIEFRDSQGPFQTLEDLKDIPHIRLLHYERFRRFLKIK